MSKLAHPPKNADFTQKTIQSLDLLLAQQAKSSRLISVGHVNDLLLTNAGLVVVNKFKYSTTALAEVCRSACPGLWKVVSDLSGVNSDCSGAEPDNLSAIKVFNAVVSARFAQKLYGRTVVADDDSGTYAGILGPSYQYLPNLNLFEMLRSVADGLGLELQTATVVGRRIRWIFCWPNSFAQVQYNGILDRYMAGFAVTNDETGEAAIRGNKIWFSVDEGLVCPRQAGLERLIHTGQNFDRKLVSILRRMAAEPTADVFNNFEKCLGTLSKTHLKLTSEDVDGKGERYKKVLSFLTRSGVTRALAEQVFQTTCRRGTGASLQQGPAVKLVSSLHKRTVYDLFVSLMRAVKQLSIFQREGLECSSFNLLQAYGYESSRE